MINFLLVLVKTSYTENFKLFQKACKIIFATFYNTTYFHSLHISTHYNESCDKKLWQFSNFSFQGYIGPLNKNIPILMRKFHFTSPWESFTFFKSYKWYQIAQTVTYKSIKSHFHSQDVLY